MEGADRRLRPRHARRRRRRRLHRRLRRDPARRSASATARKLFNVSSGAYTGASPAIVDGRAYYGTYENEVLAVDLKTHKIVWRYKHPERNFPFYSSAALSGGRVIVGGRDKMVHALDLQDRQGGVDVHDARAHRFVAGVAGGRVYVGSNDGKLYVLDAASGKAVFEFEAGRAAVGLAGDCARTRCVIGSQDGKLFCLGADSGHRLRALGSKASRAEAGYSASIRLWPPISGSPVRFLLLPRLLRRATCSARRLDGGNSSAPSRSAPA